MDPGKIFQIITNSTLLATRLLSGAGRDVEFTEPRYCLLVREDAPPSTPVIQVTAAHKDGLAVRYSITGGNRDGLFTIHQRSGLITLAAYLDFELQAKHELVVAAEVEGRTAHSIVHVTITDVNDNPPQFVETDITVNVMEEEDHDLPMTIAKVEARDIDVVDAGGLVYSIGGDGVDGFDSRSAFFSINSLTGEITQLKALDRDPPRGRATWRVKVQVRDGQRVSPSLAASSIRTSGSSFSQALSGPMKDLGKITSHSLVSRRPRLAASQTQQGDLTKEFNERMTQSSSVSRRLEVSHKEGDQKVRSALPDAKFSRMKEIYSMDFQNINGAKAHDLHRIPRLFQEEIPTSMAKVSPLELHQQNSQDDDNHNIHDTTLSNSHDHKFPNGGRNWEKGNTKIPFDITGPTVHRLQEGNTAGKIVYSEDTNKSDKYSKTSSSSNIFVEDLFRGKILRLKGKVLDRMTKDMESDIFLSGAEGKFGEAKSPKTQEVKNKNLSGPSKTTELVNIPSYSHFEGGEIPLKNNPVLKVPRRVKPTILRYGVRRKHGDEEHVRIRRMMLSRKGNSKRETLFYGKLESSTKNTTREGQKHRILSRHNEKGSVTTFSLNKDFHDLKNRKIIAERSRRDNHQKRNGEHQEIFPDDDLDIFGRKTRDVDEVPEGSRRTRSSQDGDSDSVQKYVNEGGCPDDETTFSLTPDDDEEANQVSQDLKDIEDKVGQEHLREVHVVETVVIVMVKDVNDNPPVFPNTTIYGEVQENGPIDLSVAVVSAWDADDEAEGTNAQVTYAIEKNVIEERSGQAIFAVHPDTGLIRTAICCLDRETTPEYHLQVVALDGGGLKGTGSVVVRLADVNDNSPRLSRDVWEVEVEETWGDSAPSNNTLLHLSTSDPDTSNYFFYRVVENSGWGWQHFGIRTIGTDGEVYALQRLDFEDPAHRRGFRFLIQVTDRGRGGWQDDRHTDTAWIVVHLQDVNDNPPQFRRSHDHVTVREDAALGTLLASLPAHDPDMVGKQSVKYTVVGGWSSLTVDSVGGVRLWRALDREAPGGEVGVAKVVSVDDGHPPLSSTATLTITVTDVNDCPPRLLPPTTLHVTEGTPPARVGVLTATDGDVWALGHGPPFSFSVSNSNPAHVLRLVTVKHLPSLDSGRGGAEVWTLGPIDREEHRHVTVEVVVTDSGGLAATHPVTVIVDDVNDNPMRPASKMVYLWKMQGVGLEACLGRVYVEDADDWDLEDKTFAWVGPPHPLFSLQPETGDIYASPQVREGRYDLKFSVSDAVWGQHDVRANVTVGVRYLSPEALAHAVPVTLTPTTPADLTKDWTPTGGGGGLGTLSKAVKEAAGGDDSDTVEIVSVYGLPASGSPLNSSFPKGKLSMSSSSSSASSKDSLPSVAPFASVWVSVRVRGGGYMDPVKLQGLLALHMQHMEKVMNLRMALEDATLDGDGNGDAGSSSSSSSSPDGDSPHHPSSVASLASTALPLQVVDTNSTSLVTPRLTRAHDCHVHTHDADVTCTITSCLNNGKCVRTDRGDRCVCPGGSWGPKCKVLARTFSGSGWAWVKPLPPCLPITLSLRVLTRHSNALLLYSGPLLSTSAPARYPVTPVLLLQLVHGQPQAVIEGPRGPIKLQVNSTLQVNTWHTLHLHVDTQGVTLMVDICGQGWSSGNKGDSHCVARSSWADKGEAESWSSSSSVPLQVGGLAHPSPSRQDFGWSAAPVNQALDGCISHLTVNGQLLDLGEPAHSSGSTKGCAPQESACPGGWGSCGWRGHCMGGLITPRCECEPGWSGKGCHFPTTSAALGPGSYVKVALSFRPDAYSVTAQLRVRARGRPEGLLLQLAAQHRAAALSVRLRGGVACASVSGLASWMAREACVEATPIGDGVWHTLYVARHGHNLIIAVDDGDGWRRNETLASLLSKTSKGKIRSKIGELPVAIMVDKQDGVTVGGVPDFVGVDVVKIHDDLYDVCVDDVRVSGLSLPLPPAVNGTSWGQATSLQQVERGCPSTDVCSSTTCAPPLTCHDSWRQSTCSCGPGRQVVGSRCPDVDECVWHPCLHGGTCVNLQPGYLCMCGPSHAGNNCQWVKLPPDPHPLTAPMAIAALTVSLLVLVVVGVLLTLRLHQSRAGRGTAALRSSGVESVLSTPMGVEGVTEPTPTKHQEPREGQVLLDTLSMRLSSKKQSLRQEDNKKEDPARSSCTPVKESSTVKGKSSKDKTKGTSRRTSLKGISCDITQEKIPSISRVVGIAGSRDNLAGNECGGNVGIVSGGDGTDRRCSGIVEGSKVVAQPLLAQDDLRAYAYEGDGSPSGSLTSTVLGLHTESIDSDTVNPLIPEYGEVLDLLRTLPDAANTSVVHKEVSLKSSKASEEVGGLGNETLKMSKIGSKSCILENKMEFNHTVASERDSNKQKDNTMRKKSLRDSSAFEHSSAC